MAKFTVDTHLFRELGELLVGRDSTALIELIKNAYDADATEVTVLGKRLDDPSKGQILVADNGVGMDVMAFEKGFLRVASRMKEQGDRRSLVYNRRFTGAKGIGRLAAHKLARKLEIESVSQTTDSVGLQEKLFAAIDWDEIESYEVLDDIESSNAIRLESKKASNSTPSGTTLKLSRLRRTWTSTERARFFSEVQSFDPPKFLSRALPQSVVDEPLLFEVPEMRDNNTDPTIPSFQVNLVGDFAVGEEYWVLVAGQANWVLEIRTDPNDGKVFYAIAPTKKKIKESPQAKAFSHSISHPSPDRGPHFDARILVREGHSKFTRDQRVWTTTSSGVKVYLEGFRVLPYGDPNDDWLSIDADYTRRPRQLEMLKDFGINAVDSDPNIGLVRVPSNNYFGAVFLKQNLCPDLRILVNREGFVPEASYEVLVNLVRMGVDLLTRERAATSFEDRQHRREERRKVHTLESDIVRGSGTNALSERIREATQLVEQAGKQLTGESNDVKTAAVRKLDEAKELAEELISESILLNILASVGTQMAAFVHEIKALIGSSQSIETALEGILAEDNLSIEHRRLIRRLFTVASELKRSLERQASYLTDVISVDARRRRSRQPLVERFDSAVKLIHQQADKKGISITNAIPGRLKSPPMFSAEITAIFANLLTNATKAAGENGKIQVSASRADDFVRILVQNTGIAVNLNEADRWFKPFQSTTSEVDPALGQGMGLGLTITRNILENYGASVEFIRPEDTFATALEIKLPVTGNS